MLDSGRGCSSVVGQANRWLMIRLRVKVYVSKHSQLLGRESRRTWQPREPGSCYKVFLRSESVAPHLVRPICLERTDCNPAFYFNVYDILYKLQAMRLLLVPLLLAGLSATSVTAHESVKSRKSLGFGPVHPHAVFRSNPSDIPQSFGAPQSENPLQLAQNFAQGLIPPHLDGAATFVLRKDSYTDKNTGVTHAYLRQFINGLEVADGDLNVNVKGGIILSYGNSVRNTRSHDLRSHSHD